VVVVNIGQVMLKKIKEEKMGVHGIENHVDLIVIYGFDIIKNVPKITFQQMCQKQIFNFC
jgi:hypothetical protein